MSGGKYVYKNLNCSQIYIYMYFYISKKSIYMELVFFVQDFLRSADTRRSVISVYDSLSRYVSSTCKWENIVPM